MSCSFAVRTVMGMDSIIVFDGRLSKRSQRSETTCSRRGRIRQEKNEGSSVSCCLKEVQRIEYSCV